MLFLKDLINNLQCIKHNHLGNTIYGCVIKTINEVNKDFAIISINDYEDNCIALDFELDRKVFLSYNHSYDEILSKIKDIGTNITSIDFRVRQKKPYIINIEVTH